MSVHYLEQYLLADDLHAGAKLLEYRPNQTSEYRRYRNTVSRIARERTRFCSHHFDDVVQEAHIRVLNQVQCSKFISAFFCRAFRAQGGSINLAEPHLFEVLKVPIVIQRRAAQLYSEEPLRLQYERVCFNQQYANISQSAALLLTCTHPLRSVTIELALGSAGVSNETLQQFYRWATRTAQNRIIDCIRAIQREQTNQSSIVTALSASFQDNIDSYDNTADADIEIDDITELVASLDQIAPHKQYLQLWHGLVEKKPQKQIALDLSVSQSEITKRKQELKFYMMEWLGLISPEEAISRRNAIRRPAPVERSNRDY